MALLEPIPVIDQQMIKINIQRDAGETPPPGTEAAFHFLYQRMPIGKPIDRPVILQASHDGGRQPVLIETAREITKQITDRRFNSRLR